MCQCLRVACLRSSLISPARVRPCPPSAADAQPGSFQLMLGGLEAGPQGFVEVRNPNAFAADVSGWGLRGAVRFTFAPGGSSGRAGRALWMV